MNFRRLRLLPLALLFPLIAGVAGPLTPSSSAAGPAVPAGWKLDVSDDFNSINTARWNVVNNSAAPNESSYILSRNTSAANGVLRIQAKKESYGGRSYTSGYLNTIGKYSLPNYFRAEVRAKVPWQQGLWAAPLWFRPTSGDGEIDMVETYGNERAKPTFHHTIHTSYGSSHQQFSRYGYYSAVSTASAYDWHTYTMEKVKGKITMWVDGVKTYQVTPYDVGWYNAYYEVGKRWSLRMNLQVGSQWAGYPTSTNSWSGDNAAMQVDYVKTWIPG